MVASSPDMGGGKGLRLAEPLYLVPASMMKDDGVNSI